jgi:hypothetical protein
MRDEEKNVRFRLDREQDRPYERAALRLKVVAASRDNRSASPGSSSPAGQATISSGIWTVVWTTWLRVPSDTVKAVRSDS